VAEQSLIEQYRAVANEVAAFAGAELDAARLPGAQFGPADAYRHIVAAAELRRRLGPVAAGILEGNEMRSIYADMTQMLTGASRHPANSRAARDMDRHNNAVGVAIGATAETPEEVVGRARQAIDHARQWGGSGHQNTAYWTERSLW